MINVAELSANLQRRASHERIICLLGRTVRVYGRDEPLATTACRSMSIWPSLKLDAGISPDDVCVVDLFSEAQIKADALGHPVRSYHHPHMGTFLVYETVDGSAVAQPGRGAILCSKSGELVWLVEDDLLKRDHDRWPNLTDLSIVLTVEILRRGGNYLTHAGAVGRNGRCLLLAGESGSGKTTFTMRKVMEGWDFYGDDMVIVGRDEDGVWKVYPFWRPIHLTAATLELVGGLKVPDEIYTVSNKLRCDITQLAAVRQPPPGVIEKVFCLQAGWHPPTLTRLPRTEALSALGATFLSGFIPQNAESDLDNLLDFLSAIPAYEASWSAHCEKFELVG